MNSIVSALKSSPATSSRFAFTGLLASSKVGLFLGVMLISMALFMVGFKVFQAQPANITINPNNLSRSQYQILNAQLADYQHSGFFTAALPEIESKILALDWVGQTNIERRWQSGIVVTVLPRRPVARFGSDRLIDAQSQVFKPVDQQELNRQDLIMLHGEIDQSLLIMQQMQQVNQWFAPIEMQVEDLVLTPRMTWVLKFDTGLRVIVDNERTSQKLMNLSQLLQNQLANKVADIDSIDLRYKNGFVIAWQKPFYNQDLAI